jgi:propanediol dehydratase small subunit
MTVTVAQVATELARPTPDSPVSDQWQSWLDRAYRLIENRLGTEAYAALDENVLDDVVLIAVTEHVRAWRDTTASRYTVSVDDSTVSRQYERAAGLLEIPDDLWPLLGVEAVAESFTIEP